MSSNTADETHSVTPGIALAQALGGIDHVARAGDAITVSGWLLDAAHPIDRVLVRVSGTPIDEADVILREDVARAFPDVPHAARSGVLVSGAGLACDGPLRVEVIGRRDGRDAIRFEQFWIDEGHGGHAPPELELIRRVGSSDPNSFQRDGYNVAVRLLRAVREHTTAAEPPRLLDWGCGSGRATQFMPELWPGLRLTGCDIDAEAIGWCRQQMPNAAFQVTNSRPPLPFADASFDAVVASSVMTHLTGSMQRRWLREIHRILASDGLFVGSVIRTAGLPVARGEQLRRNGILYNEKIRREGITDITWQTEAFTRRHWSQGFRDPRLRGWRARHAGFGGDAPRTPAAELAGAAAGALRIGSPARMRYPADSGTSAREARSPSWASASPSGTRSASVIVRQVPRDSTSLGRNRALYAILRLSGTQ